VGFAVEFRTDTLPISVRVASTPALLYARIADGRPVKESNIV